MSEKTPNTMPHAGSEPEFNGRCRLCPAVKVPDLHRMFPRQKFYFVRITPPKGATVLCSVNGFDLRHLAKKFELCFH